MMMCLIFFKPCINHFYCSRERLRIQKLTQSVKAKIIALVVGTDVVPTAINWSKDCRIEKGKMCESQLNQMKDKRSLNEDERLTDVSINVR